MSLLTGTLNREQGDSTGPRETRNELDEAVRKRDHVPSNAETRQH